MLAVLQMGWNPANDAVVPVAGGDRRPATIVGRDPTTGIAVLRVEGAALAAVTFAYPTMRAGALPYCRQARKRRPDPRAVTSDSGCDPSASTAMAPWAP